MTSRGVVGLLLALGAVFLTAGLIFGHSDLHRLGANCGSALGGANQMSIETADLERAMQADAAGATVTDVTPVADACSTARSNQAPIAYMLIIPAVGLLAAGLVIWLVSPRRQHPTTPTPTTTAGT